MKTVYKIDADGYLLDCVILKPDEKLPEDCVDVPMPEGIFLPAKFENGEWKSTLTQEEIDRLLNSPKIKTELEILKETVDQLVLDNLMRGI
ncbi:hypothetical protein [Neobacillus niacini]|uniref:hypothetical protein n=1 Tax=Neobacillus niacini TaxID=86668 RepID=UPI0021CAE775|nr:hypothetical protein [Neobacillus niacini]MCM3763438.1 hypothetical protein [Neobacillus niacini]